MLRTKHRIHRAGNYRWHGALPVSISEPGAPLHNDDTSTDMTITTSGGTPPYSYRWNTGYDQPEWLAVPVGTYSVEVADANGCTVELTDIKVDLVLAADTPHEQKLKVFPNPAHSNLEIRLPDRSGPWLLQLVNTNGQTVWSEATGRKSLTLNTSSLPAGVYYLLVSGRGDFLHECIVIK